MTKETKPMKLTIMISQPMKDLSSDKIIKTRENAIHTLETFGYDVIDNFSLTTVSSQMILNIHL